MNMKRITYLVSAIFTLAALLCSFSVSPILAISLNYDICQNGDATVRASDVCTSNQNRLYGANGVISNVTFIVATAAGITAVLIIIYAGLQYILSDGDPQKATKAKNMILFAAVGLIIIIVAETLVKFLIGRLG